MKASTHRTPARAIPETKLSAARLKCAGSLRDRTTWPHALRNEGKSVKRYLAPPPRGVALWKEEASATGRGDGSGFGEESASRSRSEDDVVVLLLRVRATKRSASRSAETGPVPANRCASASGSAPSTWTWSSTLGACRTLRTNAVSSSVSS